MKLLTELKRLNIGAADVLLRVTLKSGASFVGQFMEYTYADDNVEEIASVSLRTGEAGEPEVCLFENEICSIEIV